MRTFAKPFKGATGGNAYPQEFEAGDGCPDDLVTAAEEAGVLGPASDGDAAAEKAAAEKAAAEKAAAEKAAAEKAAAEKAAGEKPARQK